MGKLVPDLYTVGRFAIFTRPGSKIERLVDLRDVPIGIGERAGSHFTTLQVLEQILPREHIRTVHTGGPGERLLALLRGEVEAANLLDPEIAIAESKGLRALARGEFLMTIPRSVWVRNSCSSLIRRRCSRTPCSSPVVNSVNVRRFLR
jgi:hypothetical protein